MFAETPNCENICKAQKNESKINGVFCNMQEEQRKKQNRFINTVAQLPSTTT